MILSKPLGTGERNASKMASRMAPSSTTNKRKKPWYGILVTKFDFSLYRRVWGRPSPWCREWGSLGSSRWGRSLALRGRSWSRWCPPPGCPPTAGTLRCHWWRYGSPRWLPSCWRLGRGAWKRRTLPFPPGRRNTVNFHGDCGGNSYKTSYPAAPDSRLLHLDLPICFVLHDWRRRPRRAGAAKAGTVLHNHSLLT